MAKNDRKGLETDGLVIGYETDLIKNICLKVRPGRIVSLIGPNGCGKTTLLKTVTGQLKDRGGLIFLDGSEKGQMSIKETAKKLSMVMTENVRPELMTCRQVIESGRYPYTGILGRLSEEDDKAVDNAIKMCECGKIADCFFTNISDGQKKRVMLARSIAQEPAVLVLDEPAAYLDIRYKIDILTKIRNLAKEKNIAVLMSLHEPGIAMRLSDTVVAVGDGKIQRIGTPEEVFTEAFIRKLYGLGGEDISLLGERPWFEGAGQNAEGEVAGSKAADHDKKAVSAGRGGVIMIQGTMSNVGKSLITAGLCRIFAQDGYKVAPFKSQNMANNSYVTPEGLEMGRAQVMQAECAMTVPSVCMNPILLKPNDDHTSQVVLNGKVIGNMGAAEYFTYKKSLVPAIMEDFERLKEEYDIIVIEGAGSPAEINLRENDIVNMGLAQMVDAPVLLVGDIDRGGVFAQLLGTLDLLPDDERARVAGLVINKFRGDKALLEPGLSDLKNRSGCDITGVIPYIRLNIDDEDSLSLRFETKTPKEFDIAVIRFPHISNFTDLDVFAQSEDISVRFISDVSQLGAPDLVILPGTKNTLGDMRWMDEAGISEKIAKMAAEGVAVIGICGGYQMLGITVEDGEDTKDGPVRSGLGLLPVRTVMEKTKTRRLFEGEMTSPGGILEQLKGMAIKGYEIHMGTTTPEGELSEFTSNVTGYCKGSIYGTYVHGLFDASGVAAAIVGQIAKKHGKKVDISHMTDRAAEKEKQYDILADALRKNLDMEAIYTVIGAKNIKKGRYDDKR